jgi:ribosomal protein S15P/S13E
MTEFKNEINQVENNKRALTNKEAYRKNLLQYYIELNEEARAEIIIF